MAYDADCKCFRTSDKVMVFDVSKVEEAGDEETLPGSGAGAGLIFGRNGIFYMLSTALSLVFLAF